MKILAIDSSAISAGCAIMEDGRIIAESFVKVGLTHSETLLPMVSNTLANAKLTFNDIDCCAVSTGPGSFTGIRIGVSAVKGMSFGKGTPCVAVSTLEAIAWNAVGMNGIVCPAMDARRNQVYNAIFLVENGKLTRLCEDRAISIDELANDLSYYDGTIYLAGDGARLCYDSMKDSLNNIILLPENICHQCGFGVAMAGQRIYNEGGAVSPDELIPSYLRLSQAEREKKEKAEQA